MTTRLRRGRPLQVEGNLNQKPVPHLHLMFTPARSGDPVAAITDSRGRAVASLPQGA